AGGSSGGRSVGGGGSVGGGPQSDRRRSATTGAARAAVAATGPSRKRDNVVYVESARLLGLSVVSPSFLVLPSVAAGVAAIAVAVCRVHLLAVASTFASILLHSRHRRRPVPQGAPDGCRPCRSVVAPARRRRQPQT